ncbi:MAG: MotA/TolQ/ExbB proton channel family protein [Thermoguttaceae bacterium]
MSWLNILRRFGSFSPQNRLPLVVGVLFVVFLFGSNVVFNNITDSAGYGSGVAVAQEQENATQNAENQETDAPPKERSYLVWMFASLGWFFAPVFLAMSIIMVALFVINILAIRREVLRPTPLVEQFGKLLDEKKYQDAFELAKENDSFLGRVLAAGLSKMSSGYEKAVRAMQDVGEQETMQLEGRLKLLALLGNIAPMLGLFGTVVGMIASFQEIASRVTTPPAYKLAEGISTALFTTEVGLAIAIPSIVVYDILRNHLARYVLEISIICDNMMGRFKTGK